MKKFKKKLKGKRITLKISEPLFSMAKEIFKKIEDNRDYFKPWFRWLDY